MRSKILALPSVTPRNRVVLALARLARRGSGRHQPNKRQQDRDRQDLAVRVRECGEW
jgi:hypothetical protein